MCQETKQLKQIQLIFAVYICWNNSEPVEFKQSPSIQSCLIGILISSFILNVPTLNYSHA